MACDITLKLFDKTVSGNKIIQLLGESGEQIDPIEGLAKAIKTNPEFKQEMLKIIDQLDIEKVTARSEDTGLHANISYSDLPTICPIEGGWPDISELEDLGVVNKNILFVQYHKSGSRRKYGIVHDTITKKDVFVLNTNNVGSFRNYLITRLAIQHLKGENIPEEITKIAEHFKAPVKEVLATYLVESTKDKYTRNIEINGKKVNIHSAIEDFLKTLVGRATQRKYNHELCNVLRDNITYLSYTKKHVVSYSDIFKAFKEFYKKDKEIPPEVERILTSIENVKKMTGTQIIDALKDIFKLAHEFDKEFVFKPKDTVTELGKVFVDNPVTTLNDRYGHTFNKEVNQIKLFDNDYLGYRIYQFKESDNSPIKYFYTQGIVTGKSYSTMYNSLEEVQQRIRNIDTPLYKTHIKVKQGIGDTVVALKSLQYYTEGQIIRSLDIELPDVSLNKLEQQILYTETKGLNSFYKYFHSFINNPSFIRIENGRYVGLIPETVNTPEKAACFLYLINSKENRPFKSQLNQDYYDMITSVLNTIKEAKYKYYFVNQVSKNQVAQLIEVNDDFDGFKEEDSRPVATVQVLKALQKSLETKLSGTGIQVKLLTQEELIEDLKAQGVKDAENIGLNKAFLYGNTIYINKTIADISDPLHEYAHVFLGILKAKNYQLYRNLVTSVLESNPKQAARLQVSLKELYPNLSAYDLEEEIVATMYGRYVVNNKYTEFNDLEYLNSATLQATRETIFDQSGTTVRYDKKLGILAQLNTDIQDFLLQANKESLIMDFEKSGEFRQAAQAIERDLDKKLLKEDCDR